MPEETRRGESSQLDRPLPVLSWATYDFANTIYSAIVVTAFFPKFMARLAGRDLYTGLAQTTSMVLAGLVVPVAGAIADATGRGKRYLWWLTVACCAATAGIGLWANDAAYDPERGLLAPAWVVLGALVLFGLANLTYQGSLVFYNSLLPSVASPARQGFVSGLGVGLGYLGVVVALPVALFAVRASGAMRVAFVLAGGAFFVGALPLFLVVRGPRPREGVRLSRSLVSDRFRELLATVREIAHDRPVLLFFVGNFLCVDVVNTLIMWTRPYLEKGAGFSEMASGYTLMAMSVSAFVLGMGMGWLTDRLGARATLVLAAGSMLLCVLVAGLGRSRAVLLGVIVVFGSGGLAGMWTAGRKWLLEVAPEGKVGEFFGLYGVTVKLSVLGCTLFAFLADFAGYRPALMTQAVPLAVGICLLVAAWRGGTNRRGGRRDNSGG